MEILGNADWQGIGEYSNQVFLVVLDISNEYKQLYNRKREDFHGVNIYVEHGPSAVNVYKIVERVIDNKGNLILFANQNGMDY